MQKTRRQQRKHKQKGFTLVELSIVLVIIGLIVGGVLVGQDLIAAAQIRAQIAQVNEFNAAMNTFRAQYNGIPGDLNNAVALGLVADATGGNGDGNGVIGGAPGTAATEASRVFESLSTAELIPGQFDETEAPTTSIERGLLAAVSIGSLNYWVLGAADGGSNVPDGDSVADLGALTGFQAWSIDSKVDDGLPETGTMQVMQTGVAISGHDSTADMRATPDATNCSDGTDYIIDVTGTAPGAVGDCPVFVRIQG